VDGALGRVAVCRLRELVPELPEARGAEQLSTTAAAATTAGLPVQIQAVALGVETPVQNQNQKSE